MDGGALGGKPLLYIGASTISLRRRLAHHLADDSQRSTFRMSLGAVLSDTLELRLRACSHPQFFGFERDCEARLTSWMACNLLVATRSATSPAILERRLIRSQDPTLNINGRRRRQSAWSLLMLRRRCLTQAGGTM